jgi:hypothetical protein
VGNFDSEFIQAQHTIGKALLRAGLFTYFIGGFLLVHSMTKNGAMAQDGMLQVSVLKGGAVVGTVHEDEVFLAKQWESRMIAAVFITAGAVIVVLAWAFSQILA